MRHPHRRTLGERRRNALHGLAAICLLALGSTPLARAEAPAIVIESPEIRADRLTVRLRGRDAHAPRPLVLWREQGGRFRRAGETRSAADGRFDFGERARPIGATTWAVAPRGERPDRRRSIRVEGPVPAPAVVADALGGRVLHLMPALYEGALRIRDAETGRLLFHLPIASGGGRELRLDLDAEGLDPAVRRLEILQRTDDGRPSRRTYWKLEADPSAASLAPSRPAAW